MRGKRERFKAFVTVHWALIEALTYHQPGHHVAGQAPKNATFWFDGEGMFPFVVKVRPPEGEEPMEEHKPQEGVVYRMVATFDPASSFVDGKTGERCRSRDRHVVYLYPHDHDDATPDGELRWSPCNLEQELRIVLPRRARGEDDRAPVPFKRQAHGTEAKGCLWLARREYLDDYRVIREDVVDEVLFAGPVLVALEGASWTAVPGANRLHLGEDLPSIYDRRDDKLSSFARAEHVRRTIGEGRHARAFEFVNLRDIPEAEALEAAEAGQLTMQVSEQGVTPLD